MLFFLPIKISKFNQIFISDNYILPYKSELVSVIFSTSLVFIPTNPVIYFEMIINDFYFTMIFIHRSLSNHVKKGEKIHT